MDAPQKEMIEYLQLMRLFLYIFVYGWTHFTVSMIPVSMFGFTDHTNRLDAS